jgi:hypothetical protein
MTNQISLTDLKKIGPADLLHGELTEITVSPGGSAPMTIALIVPGKLYLAYKERLTQILNDALNGDLTRQLPPLRVGDRDGSDGQDGSSDGNG